MQKGSRAKMLIDTTLRHGEYALYETNGVYHLGMIKEIDSERGTKMKRMGNFTSLDEAYAALARAKGELSRCPKLMSPRLTGAAMLSGGLAL